MEHCPIPGCEQSFLTNAKLRYHTNESHHLIMCLVSECPRLWPDRGLLIEHVQTEHRDRYVQTGGLEDLPAATTAVQVRRPWKLAENALFRQLLNDESKKWDDIVREFQAKGFARDKFSMRNHARKLGLQNKVSK